MPPRPTAAQLVYGSAAVVVSTLVLLLLTQARSVAGVGFVATAALGLGVLVAVAAADPRRGGRPHGAAAARESEPRPAAAEQPVHR
ncbi:hypothetical protein C0216_26630 [Streptomyces globosus]|uniref:Uncharacterized protein n=1 Tax=Streptomyces globosus TaxID=68209 RepID=A0A344U6M0_9ACTN|nr:MULTISPECIES: hypothetical protein [Streptomyces]AXE26541.1 hypothetical protein C0216_26630 [Streptomyces globosus]